MFFPLISKLLLFEYIEGVPLAGFFALKYLLNKYLLNICARYFQVQETEGLLPKPTWLPPSGCLKSREEDKCLTKNKTDIIMTTVCTAKGK